MQQTQGSSTAPDHDRIARRYRLHLDLNDRLQAAIWHAWPWRPHGKVEEWQAITIAMLRRALDSHDASLSLCRLGRPQQALMIVRSLFEDMVCAYWMSIPEHRDIAVRRLNEQEDHLYLLANEMIRGYGLDAPDPDDLAQRREYLDSQFGPHGSRTWVDRTLYAAIKEIGPLWEELGGNRVELRIYYDTIHKRANQLLHNSVDAIETGLASFYDRAYVSESDLEKALRASFSCLGMLAELVFRNVDLDRTPFQSLGEEAQILFFKLDPGKLDKLERNAPCPCGSGVKFKKCHGV